MTTGIFMTAAVTRPSV